MKKFYQNKWGVTRLLYKRMCQLRNKTLPPPFSNDTPEKCTLGPRYWQEYPVKEYNYQFNSWGYRAEDFEKYRGQPVNICIGDSATLNIGGPVEDSWPYLLSKYFDIPTLNFGLEGICFTDFELIVQKTKKYFNVKHVFVLYNLFDLEKDEIPDSEIVLLTNSQIDIKLNVLKKYSWVHGAHWQFDAPWSFYKDELPCLYEHFPEAHDFLKNIKINYTDVDISLLLTVDSLRLRYQEISGPNWINYEKFCELFLVGVDTTQLFDLSHDKRLITEFLNLHFLPTIKTMLLTNRDGYHMSRQTNQLLADYFYKKAINA